MAEYGVGIGRGTTSTKHGMLLGNGQRRKVVTATRRAPSPRVADNEGKFADGSPMNVVLCCSGDHGSASAVGGGSSSTKDREHAPQLRCDRG